jgi:hypothetical protein
MDTEQASIFTDETSEFIGLQAGTIDLTDWPLTPALVSSLGPNSGFYVSSTIAEHGYFEIEFMLASNFWGVNMNFGNDAKGLQIRQGISHLVDKVKFVNTDPNIAGSATAIDNPLPTSNGGLPSPNPCSWDGQFNQTGSNCAIGAPGGTAYHLGSAAGVNFVWQPALGSADFCAAAQHFVNAGLASGYNAPPGNCVLTGISPLVTQNTVGFFIRSDDPPRLDLGQGLAQEICALFGQGFVTGCAPYLSTTIGSITAFTGFTTSTTSVDVSWGMYTAGFGSSFPFDSSLYFAYNSRFVSGISSIKAPTGPCSSQAVPSSSAGNYMYMCNQAYDSISSQMEFSPCFSATGDPVLGQPSNGPGGRCLNSNSLSVISAGVQTEDLFGKGAYTIPIFERSDQFGYLHNWSNVINNEGSGIANYFTWLNAYSATPAQSGTIRQGFKQTTRSLSPYIASTIWDFDIIGNIYDSLNIVDPLSNAELLDWMSLTSSQLSNSVLSYTPPPGTVSSFRFTLRSDLFWQDGRRVTSWDAKFSYLTLKNTGAFQSSGLAPMTGVTVLSPTQFDVNVNGVGPFTKLFLTGPTIIPGHYWSVCSGGVWDGDVISGQVPDSCMSPDSAKITATFDPLAAGILIGSGPWVCKSSTGVVGIGCSSSGHMNPGPGGSYTLQRFGKGLSPGSSLNNAYFRSAGNLALYLWSGNNGDFVHDFLNFGVVAGCFGQPSQPLGTTAGCGHFQQGIGANGGPKVVDVSTIGVVNRFVGLNWVQPYQWTSSPPPGITANPPVLREGTALLSPASVVGCSAAYPTGGYDC